MAIISGYTTRSVSNQKNHRLFFDGGVKFVQKALTNVKLETVFAEIASKLPPKKVVLPFMWFNKTADFAAGSTIDGKPWTYSDDPNAVLGRQADNEALELFDGQIWQPWDPPSFPSPSRLRGRLRSRIVC